MRVGYSILKEINIKSDDIVATNYGLEDEYPNSKGEIKRWVQVDKIKYSN